MSLLILCSIKSKKTHCDPDAERSKATPKLTISPEPPFLRPPLGWASAHRLRSPFSASAFNAGDERRQRSETHRRGAPPTFPPARTPSHRDRPGPGQILLYLLHLFFSFLLTVLVLEIVAPGFLLISRKEYFPRAIITLGVGMRLLICIPVGWSLWSSCFALVSFYRLPT